MCHDTPQGLLNSFSISFHNNVEIRLQDVYHIRWSSYIIGLTWLRDLTDYTFDPDQSIACRLSFHCLQSSVEECSVLRLVNITQHVIDVVRRGRMQRKVRHAGLLVWTSWGIPNAALFDFHYDTRDKTSNCSRCGLGLLGLDSPVVWSWQEAVWLQGRYHSLKSQTFVEVRKKKTFWFG